MTRVKVTVIRGTADEPNTAEDLVDGIEVPEDLPDEIDIEDFVAAFAQTEIPTTPEARVRRRRRLALALVRLRTLQTPTLDVPIVGHIHAPAKHDVIYVASIGAMIAFGVIEWPIAVAVIGGHALKQHHSRSLSAVGKAMEDAFAH